mgnify:CR=1 FL=1|tara:strand:+ start:209 stop:418 length:210 start_codon:yes stop_codon:yes gene_type:complete
MKYRRKFVSPNQKSIDLQKGLKDGEVKCTKCLKVKKQKEFTKKNYYWCRVCHNAYSRSRPKKVSYNELW